MPEQGKVQCYACSFSMIITAWQTLFDLHSIKSTGCPFTVGKAYNVTLQQQSSPVRSAQSDNLQNDSNGSADETTRNQLRVLDPGFFERLITYKLVHLELL